MKVFKDIISGDEMFSDSYKHQLMFNDAVWEVKAKMVKKGSDFVAIASDDIADEDENAEMVVDIVDSFKLNEIQLTKKDFMGYVKGFLKAVVAKLKENGKEDRVKEFQKGATEAVKFIVGKIDEMQFFTGTSYDMDAGIALCYNKDGEADPTFLYFADALVEEKF